MNPPTVLLVAFLALALGGDTAAPDDPAPQAATWGDAEPASQAPLPFDPLSESEQARAIAVAMDEHSLEVIGAALFTDKSFAELDAWPRMAEVWLYDPVSVVAVRSLVDLGVEQIVDTRIVSMQPPLTAHDIDAAGRLALADAWVQEDLRVSGHGPDALQWTGRLWVGDAPTACPQNRCILVGFTHDRQFLHGHVILVDLSLHRVLGILDGGTLRVPPEAALPVGGPL